MATRSIPPARVPVSAYLVHTAAITALGLAFAWAVSSGCDCGGEGSTYSAGMFGSPNSVQSNLKVDSTTVTPGGRVNRSLAPQSLGAGSPAVVNVAWYPPVGATDIRFDGMKPTNPGGAPPYYFAPVPVALAGGSPSPPIVVSYTGAAKSAGTTSEEYWKIRDGAGNDLTSERTVVNFAGAGAPPEAAVAPAPPEPEPTLRAAAAGYSWWRTDLYFKDEDREVTEETCNQALDAARSGRYFAAARVPTALLGTGQPGTTRVPLVKRAGEAPHLELTDYGRPPGQQTVLTLPLEPDVERSRQLDGLFPAGEGYAWAALTPAPPEGFTCPAGLFIAADRWEVVSNVAFDFGGTAGACDGCRLDVLSCYQGLDDPLGFLSGAVTSPVAAAASGSGQAEGVTCVGPVVVRLASTTVSPLVINGPGAASLTPPGRLLFEHMLENFTGAAARTVTFSLQSSQGLTWRLYRGDPGANQEITGSFTVSGYNAAPFTAVADVPALGSSLPGGGSVHAGAEVLTITATTVGSPGEIATGSDVAWLGGWTPPPVEPRLQVTAAKLGRGAAVVVSGTLPPGGYRLAVVPNGARAAGACYASTVLAAVEVTVADGVLPATTVWGVAAPGAYDVLALQGSCAGGSTIVTGDALGAAPGVEVSTKFAHLRRRIPD